MYRYLGPRQGIHSRESRWLVVVEIGGHSSLGYLDPSSTFPHSMAIESDLYGKAASGCRRPCLVATKRTMSRGWSWAVRRLRTGCVSRTLHLMRPMEILIPWCFDRLCHWCCRRLDPAMVCTLLLLIWRYFSWPRSIAWQFRYRSVCPRPRFSPAEKDEVSYQGHEEKKDCSCTNANARFCSS